MSNGVGHKGNRMRKDVRSRTLRKGLGDHEGQGGVEVEIRNRLDGLGDKRTR